MPATMAKARVTNLAKLLDKVGNVPLERIGFPVGTATEQDLIDYLEAANKRLFELVDGALVEKTLGFKESFLATEISWHIRNYLETRDLGVTFATDGPFRIRIGRVRMPDTGFISWDRLPGGEVPDEPILDAVPNLAVEVITRVIRRTR